MKKSKENTLLEKAHFTIKIQNSTIRALEDLVNKLTKEKFEWIERYNKMKDDISKSKRQRT